MSGVLLDSKVGNGALLGPARVNQVSKGATYRYKSVLGVLLSTMYSEVS